jgi:imidazolonepropionase-like amidohydrolase
VLGARRVSTLAKELSDAAIKGYVVVRMILACLSVNAPQRAVRPIAAVLFAATLPLTLAAGQTDSRLVTITAHQMLDVERGALVREAVVVIEGDRIVATGPKTSTTARGRTIDLGDVTLLPGLIDAHVHLTLGGAPDANATATLRAGFTTVQDLGALGNANILLRKSIKSGKVSGPRIVSAGPWLGETGLTCDFQGIGVKGAEAFRARVRKDVEAGADLIKVCASGWLAQAAREPDALEISDDELRAAIEEAHLAYRRVAVHAISQRAVSLAIAHGADLIVHGGFTSAETIAAMKVRDVRQLPTLWSFKQGNPPALYEQLRAHMADAVGDGLPIAFGTDAGVIPHGSNANEFLELESIGLSPIDAIRAATMHAAKAVGMVGDIGVLRRGALADVIAVRGNPLDDLRALQNVTFVMKGGVVMLPR